MPICTPERALEVVAKYALNAGLSSDNPQVLARINALRKGLPIDEAEIIASGGCDHPDPTLRTMGSIPQMAQKP